MSRLGAIFAGGASRRFGADKAAALLDGRALIEHVAARLRGQCDHLVVVGRDWPGLDRIDDRPVAGLGPLGALAGALRFAAGHGYVEVVTSGCDLADLPIDLAVRLTPGPAVATGQPLLGLWPAALADNLLDHLATGSDRSMRGWIATSGARTCDLGTFANINTPTDLAAYRAGLSRSEDPRSRR